MPPSDHADGAGLQACDMGALVDPPRQPGNDNEARLSHAARQPLGECESRSGSVAGAYDRDRRLAQNVGAAPKSENRRRGIDLLQRRRIIRLAQGDETDAKFASGDELFFDLFDRSDADRALRAAAPRELRQRLQRGSDATAIGDERPKGPRTNILRACKPQPIEALLVGKTRLRLVRHSL